MGQEILSATPAAGRPAVRERAGARTVLACALGAGWLLAAALQPPAQAQARAQAQETQASQEPRESIRGPAASAQAETPALPLPEEQAPQEQELPTEVVEAPAEVVAGDGGVETPLRPGALVGGTGPEVARIEVRSDAPFEDLRELRQLIAIQVGERLTERAVRRTLRNLQATGAAYEVALYTRPASGSEAVSPSKLEEEPASAPGGEAAATSAAAADQVAGPVVVVLVVRAAVQIDGVELQGDLGIDRRTLEDRILVARGQPLIESRVLRSVYRLKELYERRGYLDASVRLSVETDDRRKLARITFQVDSGRRATIGMIRFDGDLGPFTPDELLQHLRLQPGDPFRRDAVGEDADRLQQWLVEQKYRKAEVEAPEEHVEQGDGAGGRVDLDYTLQVGPRVEVEIVGASSKELSKKDLLPFLSEEGYDEALVLQAVDRVRFYFQQEGHWKVNVDWHEEHQDGAIRLVFKIDPGPVYTLQAVRFEGNEEVSDAKLAELMETAPKRLLALGSGRLVTTTLQEDLDNIRSYYALQGYLGSKVGPAETRVDGRDITLVIPIEEGHRRQVVDLVFEHMKNLDEAAVRRAIPLASGGPYHPVLLEDSLQIIRGLYEEKGFADAQVSAQEDWNAAKSLVDVTIDVSEGPRTVVDRIILRGNYRTEDEVLERAVDLKPGDPVSRSQLLEVERRLYGLGLFSRVDVELGPADLSERTRDVIVRVEEGRTHRVSYGIGYGTDDGFAGLFGYTHRNLWGRGITLQSDLRYGQKERLARAVLDQPNVTRWHLPVLYSLTLQSEKRPSYQVDRAISQVEAVYQAGAWRYGLAFDYRIVKSTLDAAVVDLEGLDPLERRDQDVKISSIIPNLFIDRRDDPLEPTRGWTASLRFQYAFPLGNYTDAHFIKTVFQHTHYLPLAHGYLAGNLRLGTIEPLADATPDPTLPPGVAAQPEPENLRIPIDERLFAGGDYSHRAYSKDALGIPVETLFADGEGRGGNGLALVNLDYRFPVWGALGGVLFFDTGNVWPDWKEIDPTELKSGIGVGLRYVTPIGPLRAGVAYKLDPEPGLGESDWRFFVAVGNPF